MKTSSQFNADLWNGMVDQVRIARPLKFEAKDKGGWNHPWTVRARHDPEFGWVFSVKPGFVAALDPEVTVPYDLASSLTRDRFPEETESVSAWLCERPEIPIPRTRLIGEGSAPSRVDNFDGSTLTLNYEPVPAYFREMGVFEPDRQTEVSVAGGISEKQNERPEDARVLRAFDLFIEKDRLAAKVEWDQGSLAAGTGASFTVSYGRSAPLDDRPRLRAVQRFIPTPQPGPDDLLAGLFADPEVDQLKIATVYLVSPPGVLAESEPDESWSVMTRYNVYHNVHHEPASIPPDLNSDPVTIRTGLLFGLADSIGNQLLSLSNSASARLLEGMQARSLAGHFYTV